MIHSDIHALRHLADDALWHKDAIIYELHIRAFNDSNDDGIGDIPGLIDKLDYLADLGVTALWLLPFYPSPLRDGGYDIAEYTGIHESYGTKREFARLLREAHERGLRIITELVLNHTSMDHPWFQRARRSPPGSKYRDFYVWSDTPNSYEGARIIFKDFETSNWTWDPVAKAYYWHRFYSHQPDLNFDHGPVREALMEVLDFWLDMGVDGLRLDAVPYLYERQGTNCENLPETHAFLRELRAHVDAKYKHRILLAEANQWPSDAAAYFGRGDECHMNFHFPLMPRMFMALELEDTFPIINILKQTPPLPEACQWATFLRNHDELTLEMVTDEDRDTMWRAYANERTARINLGIRRRLAPLLRTRRKIELMNALLLSLPGSPVIYYGDEIGMGDNIYLGDRDGVRTPMQWSGDRNAGFSRANPQKLYLPTVIDPEFHYQTINVEAQQQNPSSLLWWMKRLIAKRKELRVFGRGSIDFLPSDNTRVVSFVREHEGEAIMVVANLSRFVQCVAIDASHYAGLVPRETFGRARFPPIEAKPYFLSLAPHTFFWLSLEKPAQRVNRQEAARMHLRAKKTWRAVFSHRTRRELLRALVEFVVERRWYRGKARAQKDAGIIDVLVTDESIPYAIVLLGIDYEDGPSQTYMVPIAFAEISASEGTVPPSAVVATLTVDQPEGRPGESAPMEGVLFDALASPAFAAALLATMQGRRTIGGEHGQIVGTAYKVLREATLGPELVPKLATAEQSNSSIVYGEKFILKVFRAIAEGPNPESEIGRYLAQKEFPAASKMAGTLDYKRASVEPSTIAALFEFVPNQGDAWKLTLESLDRFFDLVKPEMTVPTTRSEGASLVHKGRVTEPEIRDRLGPYLYRVALLAQRSAELHLTLADEDNAEAFVPQPFDAMHQQSLFQFVQQMADRIWTSLRKKLPTLDEPTRALAQQVLAREADVTRLASRITQKRIEVDRIRVHGDFHLGQVLWTGDDFVIVDFEGEPARPLSQRRFKRCPLRDVAGMLRSFHYAAASALQGGRQRAEDIPALEHWAGAWVEWVSREYVASYLQRIGDTSLVPRSKDDTARLLEFYLLEKCVYEISYELDNRPHWLHIPLRGLCAMLPPKEVVA
jgi:maltose alpha-D-glucosyltransferase/alpha-amylase